MGRPSGEFPAHSDCRTAGRILGQLGFASCPTLVGGTRQGGTPGLAMPVSDPYLSHLVGEW
jgi:hypothetical protein